jgi:hypothetical protein
MRKLASIKKIKSVSPISGADRIELVQLDDWFCIAKKNEFNIGDKAVYFEIDSFLPVEDRYSFLESSKRDYLGVQGYRIKTMKMRGVISQGLALPLNIFPEIKGNEDDVTDILKITKYDVADASPSANSLKAGDASGSFPIFLRKTDQERCLSGDTLIQTSDGVKNIKDICENNIDVTVLSFNHSTGVFEYKKIINFSIMSRKKIGWKKIRFKSGRTLIVTDNHKIWCEDILAYREVKKLEVGQKVIINSE